MEIQNSGSERITRENNTIKNVGWTIGNHCNARCKHCYSWKVRQGKSDLQNDEIDRIVRQLEKLGIETINLGGNEPIFTNGPEVTKSVLPYMVRKLTSIGAVVGMTTNGTTPLELITLDPQAFDLVNDWDISLDSPFENEHDANRGEGIYRNALKALQLCKERGKPHSIIVCGMNWNTSERHLQGLLALAKEYDAEIRLNSLRPTEKHHWELLPTAKQFYSSLQFLMDRTKPVVVGEPLIAALCKHEGKGCSCGINSMRIHSKTPEGTIPVSPCVYLSDLKVGNLLKDDIFDIINSEQFNQMRARNFHLPAECRKFDCEYAQTCRGGCAARAYLVNGKLDSTDSYCPKKADRITRFLRFPAEKPAHKGIRVHENYLCTWIGRPI